MNLRSFRIGTRLGLGFGIILLCLIGVLAAALLVTASARQELADGMRHAAAKSLQANAMRSALLEGGLAMRNVGLQYSTPDMEREEGKLKVQRQRFEEAKAGLLALGLSEQEKALVDAIATLDKQTEAPFREAIELVKGYANEAAGKLISSRIDPLNQKAFLEIEKLVGLQQNTIAALDAKSERAGRDIIVALSALGLLTVFLGGALSWLTTRSITRPLQDAVAVAQRVAAGKLGEPVTVAGQDELSELLQALKDMDDSLSRIVSHVRDGTNEIASASNEIAAGNANLSSRTESQASALEETASSMEELTSTVKQNAGNAREANQLVQSASESALKGGEVVGRVVNTMSSIKDSSRKIVDIIGVIDGIAFQTNILALNAAVEAARAGEQGRGFAVVASEVRTLAQRSAQAAKEIKELIGDSVNKVEAGNVLVDDAGKQMREIVTAVKHVADIMNEITAASEEQSAGIEEINRAIATMDEMTQHNAALVEEAAAAAASMQHRAAALGQAVAAFHLAASQAGSVLRAAPRDITPAPASLKAPASPAALGAPRKAGIALPK